MQIPPYQDVATLCANLCVSERTVDAWVKQGILPIPRQRGGKRLWKWSEVETYLDRDRTPTAPDDLAEAIREDTRRAAQNI